MRCLVGRAQFREPFGPKGRRWLSALELPEEERESVDSALRQIDFLDSEIEAVERLVAAEALDCVEVKRLMTAPGVNLICAAMFHGGGRRHPQVRFEPQAGRLPRPRSARGPVGHEPRDPRPRLKAGIDRSPPRARRGELVGRPPAGAAARVL
jgi:hypothetical protein